MAVDPTTWMPSDMTEEEKQAWADAYPLSPHEAAARAWEAWADSLAASVDIEATGVTSATTGAQSVTYAEASGVIADARRKASYHWARTARTVRSPDYPASTDPDPCPPAAGRLGPPTWPTTKRTYP